MEAWENDVLELNVGGYNCHLVERRTDSSAVGQGEPVQSARHSPQGPDEDTPFLRANTSWGSGEFSEAMATLFR